MDFVVRTITKKELDIPIEWAAQEGWNPGISDANAFYAADPKGFFMGFLGDEPVASLSAVSYGAAFGFLGLYIVKPGYRGKGYGWKLWQEVLARFPTHNIGLDGVVTQQNNYRKTGFKFAYRNIRYEGKGTNETAPDPHIQSITAVPLEHMLAYDQAIFLYPRPDFLSVWIKQPHSLAVGYVHRHKLKGYGVIRPCRRGYKIGPLFADNHTVADTLLTHFLSFAGPEAPVFLDVPELNKEAVKLVESRSWKPMFETARMYTKHFPGVPIQKVFGITTFEIG